MYIHKGIQSEVIRTKRFDEKSDLCTTYLGKIDITRASNVKAEENFPISEQGYMIRKLLGEMEWQILLDTGASESHI